MHLTDRLITVVLHCCIIQPVVLGIDPCKLKIFVEDVEDNTTDICLGEYTSPECRPFVDSFNRSVLPEGYPNESLSIERPSNINLVGLNSFYSATIYPGLTIQWAPPVSEAAKRDLEGFLIIWKDTKNYCRLFKFKPGLIQKYTKVTFSYDIERLNPASNYSVTVYSTPPPKPGDQNNEKVFLRMRYTTFIQYPAQGASPGMWAPSVSVKTWNNGSVHVKFTRSPPEFNLTLFEVLLLKTSDLNNYFRRENYSGQVYSKENPEGFVSFSGLPPDEYFVKVRPKDPYPYDVTKCLCWKFDRSKFCEGACASTSTDVFLVNVTEEPLTEPPLLSTSSPPTVEWRTTTPTNEDSSENVRAQAQDDKTAWIIGGSLLGVFVILVGFLLAFFCRNGELLSQGKVKNCFHRICPVSDKHKFSISPNSLAQIPPTDNKAGSPSLVKRTVYIMSADDHDAHIEVVKSLAQFLEVHCYCQVIYPPLEEDLDNAPYTWFLRSMSKTERIIFVDSEGAEKLVQAHVDKKTYKSRELPPQGDLFTMCLKHIFNDATARSNLVLVHFGTERCNSSLNYPPSFQLPKQFPGFLRSIHSISQKSTASYACCLPMCVDNIKDLPQGAKLLSDVELSKSFERDNPLWLQKYFGMASPEYLTMPSCSGDSGISEGYDLGRSVSTQDISTLDTSSPRSPMYSSPFFGTGRNEGKVLQSNASHPSRHVTEPELSVYTVQYDSIEPSSVVPDNIYDVIPPELISHCGDTISQLLSNVNKKSGFGSLFETHSSSQYVTSYSPTANINKNSGLDSVYGPIYENGSIPGEEYSGHFIPPNGLEDFQKTILPPESPSDEDNTSSALREFNYKYDNSLC